MSEDFSLTIAIDGYSACGKSTLARAMARRLGYRYIDTGAMYRVVTLYLLRQDISLDDEPKIDEALQTLNIDFSAEDNHALLNGEDVEHLIRGKEVSDWVSPVAALPAVRRHLRDIQRKMGATGGVVMDGRDIGTVIFPDADLKLFIIADVETRVDRRLAEHISAGRLVTREEVRENLLARDYIDSTREDSPLRQAEDAIVIDNTDLSLPQLIE